MNSKQHMQERKHTHENENGLFGLLSEGAE